VDGKSDKGVIRVVELVELGMRSFPAGRVVGDDLVGPGLGGLLGGILGARLDRLAPEEVRN
jgi:hypothetical protein